MRNPFGPLLTAMITPFDNEGNLNPGYAAELAREMVDNSSDGVVLSGTTGEAPTLTREEKLELLHAVAQELKDGKVIAGTGSNNTKESMELTREAEKAGADGIMLVVPYYNKPTQEGLYLHFKSIAEVTSLPVILYNVPGRTGINLAPETVIRLAGVDNIVALKDATKDLEQTSFICSQAPAGFSVYSGDDAVTMPVLSVGGYGVISVASHLAGRKMKELINWFHEGKIKEAVSRHHELLPLFKAMFWSANPVPVKEALRIAGYRVGSPRLPLTELSSDTREELRRLLKEYELVE